MGDDVGDKGPLRTAWGFRSVVAVVSGLKSGSGGPEERSSSGDNSHGVIEGEDCAVDQQWEDEERLLLQERLARANLMPWTSNPHDYKAITVEGRDREETSQQQSDDAISSLSFGSQQTSLVHNGSAISSIEGAVSDTSSEAWQQLQGCVLEERTSDELELDESLSSLNESIDATSAVAGAEDDACSLPSSISSLSNASPRSNSQDPVGTAIHDPIDNIPQLVARECGRDADDQAWTDTRHWEWSEYVKLEVLSSLSSMSDIDVDISSEDGDRSGNNESMAAPLIEPVEKVLSAADRFSRHPPPVLPPEERLVAYDAYVGFDELCGVFNEFLPHRDAMILDVGCGTSSICKQLALHGFSNVHGIDSSAATISLQIHEAEGLEQFVQFSDMNASALTFSESHFECVFSKAVLDKLASLTRRENALTNGQDSELQRVLSEIARCLRPGGLWINVSWQDFNGHLEGGGPTASLWWDWAAIKLFVADNYAHVKTYRCGTPFLHRGELLKPFAVRIYRKRETATQQLERWARVSFKTKQLQRQLDVREKWRQEQLQQRADLSVAEQELPVMIQEDHQLRSANAEDVYERQRLQRVKRRAALRARTIIQERLDMEEEEALAECVRITIAQVTELVRSIVLVCVDGALFVAGASPNEELRVAVGSTTSAVGMEASLMPSSDCEEAMENGDMTNFVVSVVRSVIIAAVNEDMNDTGPEKELKTPSTPPPSIEEVQPREVTANVVADIIRGSVVCVVSAESVNDERIAADTVESDGDSQCVNATTQSAWLKPNATSEEDAPLEISEAASATYAEPPASDEDGDLFAECGDGIGGDTSVFDLEQSLLSEGREDHSSELRPELTIDRTVDQCVSTLSPSVFTAEDAVQLCLFDMVEHIELESGLPFSPVTSAGEASAGNGETNQATCVGHDALVEDDGVSTPSSVIADVSKGDTISHTVILNGQSTDQSDEDHDFQTTKPDASPTIVLSSNPGDMGTDADVVVACHETLTVLVERVCADIG